VTRLSLARCAGAVLAIACGGPLDLSAGKPDRAGATDAGAQSAKGHAGASGDASANGGATASGSGGRAPVDTGSGGVALDAASGGASGAGGVPSGGATGAGGASSGGAAGTGGVADAGSNPDASRPCTLDRDCPRPPTPCAVARCDHGTCTAVNAKAGTVIPDVPGDCHDVICDGLGGISDRPLDENDIPVFENPCLAGTCNKTGVPGVEPFPARTPCVQGGGDILCDGAGNCVQCLAQSDCAPGLYCQRDDSCGTTPCTDVACGGGCTPCDLGGKCLTNRDCLSGACDYSLYVCVAQTCGDHHQDANESDVDCGGGGQCPRCPTGAKCYAEWDCQTGFCDAILHQCVTDGCTDHAPDGSETDTDCGGPVCQPCASGMFCQVDADCQSGLHCSGSPPACY